MPFRIALSGLAAASTDLQVTGHNIANAGTNGFKKSRAEFADIYANSVQDVSTTSAGRGVRVARWHNSSARVISISHRATWIWLLTARAFLSCKMPAAMKFTPEPVPIMLIAMAM